MSKSKWKIFFYEKQTGSNPQISRSSTVLPSFLNKTFNVYNGKTWTEILINDLMINCKFGEFAATRKKHVFKKKKKKKK